MNFGFLRSKASVNRGRKSGLPARVGDVADSKIFIHKKIARINITVILYHKVLAAIFGQAAGGD